MESPKPDCILEYCYIVDAKYAVKKVELMGTNVTKTVKATRLEEPSTGRLAAALDLYGEGAAEATRWKEWSNRITGAANWDVGT